MNKATVRDLAKAAGVSLATVDRVINGRSKVHVRTVEKVWQAAAKINFTKDIDAANIARQRIYRFCFVLPTGTNAFFKTLMRACKREAALQRDGRIQIEIITAPQLDNDRLLGALEDARLEKYDAIATVTQDSPEIRTKLKQIARGGTEIVNLVSAIPTLDNSKFVGIDNAAAGRCAAELLCKFSQTGHGELGILLGSMILRDHMERRFGFEQKIRSAYPGHKLIFIGECNDDRHLAEDLVSKALGEHPNLGGIYSAGGGNIGVIAALEKSDRKDQLCVVAHELSSHSRAALKSGIFDAVITQDAGHEIRSAIRIMKASVDGVDPDYQQNRIRIEIFIEGNMPVGEMLE